MAIAKIGFIGVGNIAPTYIKGCSGYDFAEVVACADMDMERARTFADEYDIRALAVDDLLADDEIDIVLEHSPESVAGLAGTDRVVEAEKQRCRRWKLPLAAAAAESLVERQVSDDFELPGITTLDDELFSVGEPPSGAFNWYLIYEIDSLDIASKMIHSFRVSKDGARLDRWFRLEARVCRPFFPIEG